MARFRIHATITWTALLVLLAAGCQRPPTVSDTGYIGAWVNGNERVQSYIMISADGDGHLFRWWARSADGAFTADCDPSGLCTEMSGGKKSGEYRFRTFADPDGGELMVECVGVVFGNRELDVHYVDRLVLDPDGLALWSFVEQRSGQTYEGDQRPKRRFVKVADDPAYVPAGLTEWGGD